MEHTFYDLVEATYRVDFFIVKKQELTAMQTKLNQWSTTKTLVKYKMSVIGDEFLCEVVRIKQQGE